MLVGMEAGETSNRVIYARIGEEDILPIAQIGLLCVTRSEELCLFPDSAARESQRAQIALGLGDKMSALLSNQSSALIELTDDEVFILRRARQLAHDGQVLLD